MSNTDNKHFGMVFKLKKPKKCTLEQKKFYVALYEASFLSDKDKEYPRDGSIQDKFDYVASQIFSK